MVGDVSEICKLTCNDRAPRVRAQAYAETQKVGWRRSGEEAGKRCMEGYDVKCGLEKDGNA